MRKRSLVPVKWKNAMRLISLSERRQGEQYCIQYRTINRKRMYIVLKKTHKILLNIRTEKRIER